MVQKVRVGIIGNGRMAKECARIIDDSAHVELTRSLLDSSRETISPDFTEYLVSRGHEFRASTSVNEPGEREYLLAGECDLVFSINNHQIIGPWLVNRFPQRLINFHNAPLPRYAGLNAPSWALFNGETEHGVTWHCVDEGIDSGDIVAQKMFDIPEGTTARRLIMLAIDHGIALFRELITAISAGGLKPIPQALAHRTFHSARDVPGDARIELGSSFGQIDRLVRALNFTPLESPFPHPSLSCAGRLFFVDAVSAAENRSGLAPGTVIRADTSLIVQGAGFALELNQVRNERGERVPVSSLVSEYGIVAGMRVEGGLQGG